MNPLYEEALRRLEASKEVCIDVETSGLSWQRNHIVGYVLTFDERPDGTYYLPFRHKPGGNIEGVSVPQTAEGWDGTVHPVEKAIIKRLNNPDVFKFGHNFSFDIKFLFRQGLDFSGRFECTMVNEALLDEWSPSFSLDALAIKHGVQAKKSNIYAHIEEQIPEARGKGKGAMGYYWMLAGDDPIAIDYACGDGVSTWQLRLKQVVGLMDQELARVHDVECRLIPVITRMTTQGIRIDEERLHLNKKFVQGKIEEALRKLPDGFNSRAPSQVRKIMEDAGHTDWPLTPKGSPSFPENWLIKYPAGQNIVAVRKWSNLDNSFLSPMLETHLWRGRVHPDFNQLRGDTYGTVTGRLSSSNPNGQQVSKRDRELGPVHRSMFVPNEGEKWGSADYKMMEPRLLAYYSRSEVLMTGFRKVPSEDAHLAVARAMNPNWESMSAIERKDAREIGKRINQTLITGGGKGVLVSKYNVDPDKVDLYWREYFDRLPEIRPLQKRGEQTMRSRGYVLTLLGRRCRLNDPNKAYQALNRLLQGGNADALKLKLCEVDEYLASEGRPISLLNNVHDALDFSFSEGNRKHYERCLEIMTDFGPDSVLPLDLPIEVDASEGKSWSEATFGNLDNEQKSVGAPADQIQESA